MSAPEVHVRPTRYEVTAWPGPVDAVNRHHYVLHVEWRGDDNWCVKDMFDCYRSDGKTEHEPIPSSRDTGFITRTRFPLDEALELARRIAPTMQQFSMHHRRALSAAESWEWESSR